MPFKFSQMAQAALPPQRPTLSYCDLSRELSDIPHTIQWCQQHGLLATMMDCPANCGRACRQVKRKGYPEGVAWRCPRKGCQKVASIRKGSFFANCNLSIEVILRLIHLWCNRMPVGKMMKELKVCIIIYNIVVYGY